MRNYLLIIAILFANCSFAQLFGHKIMSIEPVKIVITYNLKYQEDSTNPSNIRNTKMLLFLGGNSSKFISRAGYINDTATRKFSSNEQVINYHSDPDVPRSGFQYQIYKNYPDGMITFLDHIPSDTYKFEEKMNLFDWHLTGDTVTISGYKTQKATCNFGGRNWIAWFSQDLPFSDGPYKFNGLPGLIVKVYDTHNHYDFELLSISKPGAEEMIDIKEKRYIITTKQGFFQAQDSFRNDIISRAKAAGLDNSSQQIAARNLAMRNNPIELIRK